MVKRNRSELGQGALELFLIWVAVTIAAGFAAGAMNDADRVKASQQHRDQQAKAAAQASYQLLDYNYSLISGTEGLQPTGYITVAVINNSDEKLDYICVTGWFVAHLTLVDRTNTHRPPQTVGETYNLWKGEACASNIPPHTRLVERIDTGGPDIVGSIYGWVFDRVTNMCVFASPVALPVKQIAALNNSPCDPR